MAGRGPLSEAKRKREADKREKRLAKQERRARRAEEQAEGREGAQSDLMAQENIERPHRV
jgi:hypothetical protein